MNAAHTHTCTEHEPGQRTCYQRHACRCDLCRRANTRYVKRRKHAIAAGRPLCVPSSPVIAHIAALSRTMTVRAIGEAAGVPPQTLHSLMRRQRPTVQAKLAARVLAVRPGTDSTTSLLEACGVRRRLRALHHNGWSFRALAAELGAQPSLVRKWAHADHTTAETRARVVAVYDRLWDTEPPAGGGSTRARYAAARQGWAPPAAWDDAPEGPHAIDDPTAKPAGVRPAERRWVNPDDIIDAIEQGACLGDLAHRFHLAPISIEQALRRAHRHDLWAKISPRRIDGKQPLKEAA